MKKNDEAKVIAKSIIRFLEKRGQRPLLKKIIYQLNLAENAQPAPIVYSALPLSQKEIGLVKKYLEKMGKPCAEIENQVDKKVGAGLIVKINDQILDLSLQGQIAQLARHLEK